jgi:hypothetical protein
MAITTTHDVTSRTTLGASTPFALGAAVLGFFVVTLTP